MYVLSSKGKRIQEMFGAIAGRYDLLNRLLSFGIDSYWRRYAVSLIKFREGEDVLDVATGTGDMALQIAAASPASVKIAAMDFCREMVELAVIKAENSPYRERINFTVAPCEAIPYAASSFHYVTIAFGIRNVDDRERGLEEMFRVLKTGGRILIMEFSIPQNRLFKAVYCWYFCKLLPVIGGFFSRFKAYKYLPESVLEFPDRREFMGMMADAGFINMTCHDLTFGIVSIYSAEK